MLNNIMKSYITHYTPLIQRKHHIIAELSKYNLQFEFIEKYDKEKLDFDTLKRFSNVRMSEISLFMKHIEAISLIANGTDKFAIVFEDDAVLKTNYNELLDSFLNQLPNTWDVLFTADCCNIHATNILDGIWWYPHDGSRGTCMYIISKTACLKIIEIFEIEKEITMPIDFWFNYIGHKYNMQYYLSEPTIVSQGSEIGIFSTSIR